MWNNLLVELLCHTVSWWRSGAQIPSQEKPRVDAGCPLTTTSLHQTTVNVALYMSERTSPRMLTGGALASSTISVGVVVHTLILPPVVEMPSVKTRANHHIISYPEGEVFNILVRRAWLECQPLTVTRYNNARPATYTTCCSKTVWKGTSAVLMTAGSPPFHDLRQPKKDNERCFLMAHDDTVVFGCS